MVASMYMERLTLHLPGWMSHFLPHQETVYPTLDARMALVIELARQNVLQDSGGPFAAAVFERDSGRLVAAGVNRVEPLHCSSAHAEVMAIALAQAALGGYDLGDAARPAHELVTSAQPCLMCLGATLWSGVRRLVTGASGADVESILGFDEGPVPRRWPAEVRRRGIELVRGVRRRDACRVLELYRERAGTIYNSRGG
jgi:tRNA(Arg) A34 adenosine deaminase TadA